jgi:hypothetical protein
VDSKITGGREESIEKRLRRDAGREGSLNSAEAVREMLQEIEGGRDSAEFTRLMAAEGGPSSSSTSWIGENAGAEVSYLGMRCCPPGVRCRGVERAEPDPRTGLKTPTRSLGEKRGKGIESTELALRVRVRRRREAEEEAEVTRETSPEPGREEEREEEADFGILQER